MRPSLLKPGDTVNWQPDKGDPTTQRITFIERVPGNGLTKTACFFQVKELGIISMSDYEEVHRVTN